MDGPNHNMAEPPGTVQIQDWNTIVLQPQPSDDPDDPLNWSKLRKTVNFTLSLVFTLFTFVLVDIGTVAWGPVNEELGISFADMNNSFAACLAGLGTGCIFAIPLAHRYGRRPVYLLSLIVQLAGSIWQAKIQTAWELIVSNVVSGLGGAVAEVLVQMTVNDLFFVHQRGRANGLYLVVVAMGAYVALVPAGFVTVSQGWRWIWWWCVIFVSVTLVVFMFFYEESKYVVPVTALDPVVEKVDHGNSKQPAAGEAARGENIPYRKKGYRQRLALVTKTDVPIMRHIAQPFYLLLTFPAVTYTALMYGSLLCWFSVLVTTQSAYLLEDPYNFSASGIGLFNLATFVGTVIGSIAGGPVSDWWILRRAKANNGIYEPEMRLWVLVPGIILCPVGILIFGLCMVRGIPWIVLAVGSAVFGAAFTLLGDVSLSYLMDCYQGIVGDAFVAVTFIRNAMSMIFVFCLTPWIAATGLENMFVAVACIALAINSVTIPMIIWGKRARIATADRYRELAQTRRNELR